MKNILISIMMSLPVCMMAQVTTIQKLPETANNNERLALQPAFQTTANLVKIVLVCKSYNLSGKYTPITNFKPNVDYYSEVIIDNPFCNKNPEAFIVVTPVRTDPLPLSVYYDQSIEKWKIKIDINGQDNKYFGVASPISGGETRISVIPYEPRSLIEGDKFNILINQ